MRRTGCLQFTSLKSPLLTWDHPDGTIRDSAYLPFFQTLEPWMSTEVERGLGLEREGIQTNSVKWNLSPAALYEEALRRQEGVLADGGPLACRTGQHTGRSPNDKFVVREPSTEAHDRVGQGEQAHGPRALRPPAPRRAELAEG